MTSAMANREMGDTSGDFEFDNKPSSTVVESEIGSTLGPYDFEGAINPTFARACYGGVTAAPPNTVAFTQHQMRLLEAENTRSYDLTIQVGAGPEWQAPMNKAITFSTALAKRLRDVKSRPKHLALVHDGITPWMMDAMVHHWIFGDYDFDISKGRKGETLLSLREGTTKGPYATDGLAMAHMQVYLGAKLLGDEILSQTALGKFMAVLSQNKDVKTLISLVKKAFSTGFAKHDGESSVRSLLVTHAYVWDKVWLSEESREYVRLKKETPAFAQMLKEAHSGTGGKLQK